MITTENVRVVVSVCGVLSVRAKVSKDSMMRHVTKVSSFRMTAE